MLLELLPWPVLFFLLAVCCAVKHFAVLRLLNTPWAKVTLSGPRWMVAAFLVCTWGTVWMIVSFGQVVRPEWVALIAIVDWLVDWLSFVYGHRVGYFNRGPEALRKQVIMTRVIHATVYLVYIWVGLNHGR